MIDIDSNRLPYFLKRLRKQEKSVSILQGGGVRHDVHLYLGELRAQGLECYIEPTWYVSGLKCIRIGPAEDVFTYPCGERRAETLKTVDLVTLGEQDIYR